MADEGFKRKLAAILSADVEGYSRLMDDDEEATVRTLTSYRNAITDLTQQFRGRIADSPGDNSLAEFSSVVDAVICAVAIQRELAEPNTDLPYKRQMQFRIGCQPRHLVRLRLCHEAFSGSGLSKTRAIDQIMAQRSVYAWIFFDNYNLKNRM